MCINVDFPDPDGPVTATNSPASTSRFAPRSARTVTSPTWYVLTRSLIEITGMRLPPPAAAATTARTARTARTASSLRTQQRIVRVIGARCRRAGVDNHVGDDFRTFLDFWICVDHFGVRAVRDPEPQSDLLQLFVLVKPRLSA